MKMEFPLANLAVVTALVFAGAFTSKTAFAQPEGQIYAQTDLERAAQLLRGEKERREIKDRREREDAELGDPQFSARERRAMRERREQENTELADRQNARKRYIERQRQSQLEQADRDRRRQRARVDPSAPAGRDAEDPRFAPGGKP
jgi:hypothetical protein